MYKVKIMKNHIIKILLRLFKALFPKAVNSFKQGCPRILIVSTTAIGDTLWATPAILALKKRYPQSYIGLLCAPIGEQILRRNPAIDALFTFKEPLFFSFWSLRKTLLKQKFQRIYIFHASQRLVFPLCASLFAEKVVASARMNKGLDSLFECRKTPDGTHEIQRRLDLIDLPNSSRQMHIYLTKEEKESDRLSSERLHIALHAGANDAYKCWPAKNFSLLGRLLQKEFGANIYLTGNVKEMPLLKSIAQDIPGAEIISRPFREFAAFISLVDLLVTNDSGPQHLACALGTNVLAIFAPTDPAICGPVDCPHALAIRAKTICKPCLKRACPHPHCLEQITPEKLLPSCRKLIKHFDI